MIYQSMKRDLLLEANKNCQTTLFIDVDEVDIHCVHSILDIQLYTLTIEVKPLNRGGVGQFSCLSLNPY